ncbi:RpiB/LacA/LacB family sugar-phosphate isomerase [Patescibacteria group bacterium]
MKIYIGADHRGYQLKEEIKPWLSSLGHEVVDCGAYKFEPEDDFPDFSFTVAEKVVADRGSLGIVLCGSGGGVVMAANRVRGARCGQGINVEDVVHNRMHDDMNVLAIGSDFVSFDQAKEMIEAYINTSFSGEPRFMRRIAKITSYKNK